MPLITERKEVLNTYAEAACKKWVIPCFCSENLTTTEAVLAAVKEYGEITGNPHLPITLAITNNYSHRSQSVNYTHTRNWKVGLQLFIEELKILTSEYSPYKDLKVMLHLDHIQYDIDQELLNWDKSQFSSIMYDASNLSLDENIELTRKFVERCGNDIIIEGACDEIIDFGNGGNELTTPENAERYFKQTGCDFIVANLGTEHRANASELHYFGDIARKIKARIGDKIVLHGASSVNAEQIVSLFDDGICKVNIWTILERDSANILFEELVSNASKIIGSHQVAKLKSLGILGEKVDSEGKKSIDFYTNHYRQSIIFEEIKKIITSYLSIWYV
jgi:fructose-bisphosphate aldolase class II